MTENKRFIPLGTTHIKDRKTNEEFYAPCEWELLDLLNEQEKTIQQLKGEIAHYKLILMSLEEKAKRISKIK